MQRIREDGVVAARTLEPLAAEEVPESFAAIGAGESDEGKRMLVAFAPDASAAALAGIAVASRLNEAEGWQGDLFAVAPEWPASGRRLLGVIGQLPFQLIAVSAPLLREGSPAVSSEAAPASLVLSAAQIAGHLPGPADRDLFLRASRGLEGLAAKHGGALRGCGRALEFVLLARRVAELRADEGGVVLNTFLPQRSSARLASGTLSATLDGLEGQLRKRLNDRRVRDGEEGLRARAISEFRNWHSLRALVPWPLGGADSEALDWVGVDVEGRPVIGAVRASLTLEAIAGIVDAALQLRVVLPATLAHAAPPVVLDAPRLVVGGREVAVGVARALDALTLSHELFEIRSGRDGRLELVALGAGQASARPRSARRARGEERSARRGRSEPRRDAEPSAERGSEDELEAGASSSSAESGGEGRGRSRRRRGRSRGRRPAADRPEAEGDGESSGEESASRAQPRFDEVSVFELDDEPSDGGESGGARRRRGRSRQGGRSRSGGGDDSRSSAETGRAGASSARDLPAGAPDEQASLDDDFDLTDDEDGLDLAEVPDLEPEASPRYDDDEEAAGEEDSEPDAGAAARSAPAPVAAPEPEPPKLPRGRGAIIAHADRDSLLAAILLARDIRTVVGLWVYPQEELMNVFRGVATDLGDDTSIYLIGFTLKPARDVLQAASLYRDRILWFDHHVWPPEDVQGLRDAIGEAAVNLAPGSGSSLPLVLEKCSRRSRFTDKLVDLAGGRFTQHDYERWGRLWWWRLGQAIEKTGDRKGDVDGLLSGRPSDLAREAATVEAPPIPPEVSFVSQRDFRLIHFGGYGLVVLEVPEEFDLHLTARVARERYEASLSLAYRPGGELVIFAADEPGGKRSFDLTALADHVAQKLDWAEQLTDVDHVARLRIRELATHPERLDEVIGEIAMGRSILER